MSRICLGCGVTLQSDDPQKKGYVVFEKFDEAIYCKRCYRLKHYHEIKLEDLELSNEEILKRSCKYQASVYFFCDLINLSDFSMQYYNSIKGEKCFVLTKCDLFSYTISLDRVIERIRKIYHIKEEILLLSNKKKEMIITLWNHVLHSHYKSVMFLGMTNVGKSSFLNQIHQTVLGSEIKSLISEMPNTTQEFLECDLNGVKVIDAPGFNYQRDISSYAFSKHVVPKKYFRPITFPMKDNTYLLLDDYLAIKQDKKKNSTTFYGSNSLIFKRIYHNPQFKETRSLSIPDNTDLVIPGVGFFYFKRGCNILLSSQDSLYYEIRNSLFGGHYDTN